MSDYESWSDQDLVDELCDIEGMTDWEVTFTEDVAKHVEQGGTLSWGRRKKAIQILEERS